VAWHNNGPYRCNIVGVCTPHPGPNNLRLMQTWLGVLLDFSLGIALPLLLVGTTFCFVPSTTHSGPAVTVSPAVYPPSNDFHPLRHFFFRLNFLFTTLIQLIKIKHILMTFLPSICASYAPDSVNIAMSWKLWRQHLAHERDRSLARDAGREPTSSNHNAPHSSKSSVLGAARRRPKRATSFNSASALDHFMFGTLTRGPHDFSKQELCLYTLGLFLYCAAVFYTY
jgi:hypothetical protein